jgi:superfamily II RNA helicase
MAGRAGRRGKDDKGASILCVDHNFGKIPHSEEYSEMFDNKGKDLESKLKLTYTTNLNILNQDGQDIDFLIKNSFFSDANEKKKI